jgi:hypothetical protein
VSDLEEWLGFVKECGEELDSQASYSCAKKEVVVVVASTPAKKLKMSIMDIAVEMIKTKAMPGRFQSCSFFFSFSPFMNFFSFLAFSISFQQICFLYLMLFLNSFLSLLSIQ